MADVQTTDINTKPAVTAIDSNDQIFISDGGTALKKISYTNLAKAIIEQYNASQLAGATKTIQSAINELNSNTHILATTLDDLCSKILALPSSRTVPLYIPATVTSDLINVYMTGKGYVSKVSNVIADIVIYAGANGELYSVRLNPTTKEVSNVTSIPTRAEVNALNINTKYSLSGGTQLQTNVDLDTLLPGNYYTYNTIAVQHGPFSDICGIVKVEHSAGTDDKYLRQTYRRYKDDIIYERIKDDNTWKEWIKLPARAEVDALNSKLPGAGVGWHNSVYRGKNITSYLTDGSLWNRIKGAGGYDLFADLFLGDYITVGSNSYAIVDFDYYIRCGSVDVTEHHVVMMPTGNMNIPAGTALYGVTGESLTFINTTNAGVTVSSQESATGFKWNATMEAPNTNSTAGGYKYSRMRRVIMKAAETVVINAFGSSHVKPITVLYYNPSAATDSGLASVWAWFADDDRTSLTCKSICDLPNELQIYGSQVWGQGSAYNNVGYEIGIDKFQFAICALQRNFVNTRAAWWLRSVGSATYAASVAYNGTANADGSASADGVRPRFLLVG